MKISELAERVGLPAKTIRYYESRGVIPPPERLSNGYRTYSADDERRLRTVAAARDIGLPLDAIGELIALDADGMRPCRHLQALAEDHLRDVRSMIEHLQHVEHRLSSIVQLADRPTSSTPHTDAVCPILAVQPTAPHRSELVDAQEVK